MEQITFQQLVNDKKLTDAELNKDLLNLKKFSADENIRCFAGNPFLYHYQMENLCKTRIKKNKTLYEIMNDQEEYKKLYNKMIKLNRTGTIENKLFEANRFNNAVVFFKATTAKYIYKKFNAKKVLDPTAGWGGRMLGAWALDIEYTGIDTNIDLIESYQGMMNKLNSQKLSMIYEDCLKVDFSEIDYDFVLTSPPYINLEIYQNMKPYESNEMFYKKFLIPLLDKCLNHIKNNGYVCFNISPIMYNDLLKFGYRKADKEEDLLQQKRLGKDKEDKIYCWRKINNFVMKTI
jgi:hypothetical protein